jgi:hypothetical protein
MHEEVHVKCVHNEELSQPLLCDGAKAVRPLRKFTHNRYIAFVGAKHD